MQKQKLNHNALSRISKTSRRMQVAHVQNLDTDRNRRAAEAISLSDQIRSGRSDQSDRSSDLRRLERRSFYELAAFGTRIALSLVTTSWIFARGPASKGC